MEWGVGGRYPAAEARLTLHRLVAHPFASLSHRRRDKGSGGDSRSAGVPCLHVAAPRLETGQDGGL